MLDLAGRPALLLGAKRIGFPVGEALAANGMRLAIGYRRSDAEAEELAERVANRSEPPLLTRFDLADAAAVPAAVRDVANRLGGLFAVVNLASPYPRTPFDALDASAWDACFDPLRGSYLLAVEAARVMSRAPGPTRGHLVFFGDWSVDAAPAANRLPYVASKGALHALARGLAVELGERGILVNTIAPGPTVRPPDQEPGRWEESVRSRTALRRESSPSEIAELVVTLLRSETITGEMIRVDSGRHLYGG